MISHSESRLFMLMRGRNPVTLYSFSVIFINEKDSVLEAVVGGVLGQQGLLRRDLSRVFSPKSNNNYNVTESTTAMRRFPFRFYCVHIIFAFVFLAIIVNLLKVCYNTFVGSVG